MKRRTALVTGVAGQDGVYLARLLVDRGYRVVGLLSQATTGPYLADVATVLGDLRDVDLIDRLLHEERPDEIYNLAAFSSVGASWQAAELVAEVNGMAVLRLLEAIRRLAGRVGHEPRFYQASSSEIFGAAGDGAITETSPHHPRSPYGVAKSFAHHLTQNYRESYGMFACNGIMFNHESPLRPLRFVTRKITRAAAEMSLGLREKLELGDLEVTRDWGFAGEYVEAMYAMVQRDEPSDYVVATGRATRLHDFVAMAFEAAGVDDMDARVSRDERLLRPAEVAVTVGDPGKAGRDLGWHARRGVREVVQMMVDADLRRLTSGVEDSPDYLT